MFRILKLALLGCTVLLAVPGTQAQSSTGSADVVNVLAAMARAVGLGHNSGVGLVVPADLLISIIDVTHAQLAYRLEPSTDAHHEMEEAHNAYQDALDAAADDQAAALNNGTLTQAEQARADRARDLTTMLGVDLLTHDIMQGVPTRLSQDPDASLGEAYTVLQEARPVYPISTNAYLQTIGQVANARQNSGQAWGNLTQALAETYADTVATLLAYSQGANIAQPHASLDHHGHPAPAPYDHQEMISAMDLRSLLQLVLGI